MGSRLTLGIIHPTYGDAGQHRARSRLDIDADQAFDYLRRMPNALNQELVIVASEIARTGSCQRSGDSEPPSGTGAVVWTPGA